jgi:hypothetical protein
VDLGQGCGSGSESAWILIIMGSWIRVRIRVKSWVLFRIEVGIQASNGAMKAENGALEHRPVVADSYHFDEGQDPDLDPH